MPREPWTGRDRAYEAAGLTSPDSMALEEGRGVELVFDVTPQDLDSIALLCRLSPDGAEERFHFERESALALLLFFGLA